MTHYKAEGYTSISPHLVCKDAAKAIEFYKQVFGAIETARIPHEASGKIMHAALRIDDTMLLIVDEMPEWGCHSPESLKGSPVKLHIYVEDTDATMQKAVDAGATIVNPAENAFWGDRHGEIRDPFGHIWEVATHLEQVDVEKIKEAANKF